MCVCAGLVYVRLGIHKSMLGIHFSFRPYFLHEKYRGYCLFLYTSDIRGTGLDSKVWKTVGVFFLPPCWALQCPLHCLRGTFWTAA